MDSWSIISILKYKHNSWLLEGKREALFLASDQSGILFWRLKRLDNEWCYAVHLTGCLIRIRRDQALNIILDTQNCHLEILAIVYKYNASLKASFTEKLSILPNSS